MLDGIMKRFSFALLLLCGGCVLGDNGAPPTLSCDGDGREGIVSITWTINGAPPSAESCAGIARLQLRVTSSCNDGVISPVPCDLDKVRFDRQPYGDLLLELQAIGASEQLLLDGVINYAASSSPPSAPALISLFPPSP